MFVLPYLGFCQSERVFKKELKKLGVKGRVDFVSEGAGATTHYFEKDDETIIIVCIDKDLSVSAAQYAALIAHEAVHVWQWMRDDMKEKEPSAEFEAWAIQSITQKMLSACRPKLVFDQ